MSDKESNVAKRSERSFLVGWTRQLRDAIASGDQDAYEAAECIADALDLVDGPDGDAGPGTTDAEVELPDGLDGRPAHQDAGGAAEGDEQSDIARIRRLERALDALLPAHDGAPGVVGRTGGSPLLTERKRIGAPKRG